MDKKTPTERRRRGRPTAQLVCRTRNGRPSSGGPGAGWPARRWHCARGSCWPAPRAPPTSGSAGNSRAHGHSGQVARPVCSPPFGRAHRRVAPRRAETITDDDVRAGCGDHLGGDPSGRHPLVDPLVGQQTGMSTSTVARIWRAFGLKPHLVDAFKLSTDPRFIEKVLALGVRPIDRTPVDGPPSSAHSGRNRGGRTIQPALCGPARYRASQKANLRLRRHSHISPQGLLKLPVFRSSLGLSA
jgi:hypothetical protein